MTNLSSETDPRFVVTQLEHAHVDIAEVVKNLTDDGFDRRLIALAMAGLLGKLASEAMPSPSQHKAFAKGLAVMVTSPEWRYGN